jgi:hypothetical protein
MMKYSQEASEQEVVLLSDTLICDLNSFSQRPRMKKPPNPNWNAP